jgi:hypothetical protein
VRKPRAISKVISSQKLFLTILASACITFMYMRLDMSISSMEASGDPVFTIRERVSLFDKFGWMFAGIVLAYISGNVAQKHKAFNPSPDDDSEE